MQAEGSFKKSLKRGSRLTISQTGQWKQCNVKNPGNIQIFLAQATTLPWNKPPTLFLAYNSHHYLALVCLASPFACLLPTHCVPAYSYNSLPHALPGSPPAAPFPSSPRDAWPFSSQLHHLLPGGGPLCSSNLKRPSLYLRERLSLFAIFSRLFVFVFLLMKLWVGGGSVGLFSRYTN